MLLALDERDRYVHIVPVGGVGPDDCKRVPIDQDEREAWNRLHEIRTEEQRAATQAALESRQ